MRDQIKNMLLTIKPGMDVENSSFVGNRILDSFDIASLIAVIEETYSIDIDGEDIVPESFQNIQAIEELIQKYVD